MKILISNIINFIIVTIIFFISGCEFQRTYYDSGELKEEVPLDLFKKHGELKQYYKNGNLKLTSNWLNGTKQGEAIEYFKNGKIKTHGFYENDKPHGQFKQYDSLGNLHMLYEMKNGVDDGVMQEFYSNGNIFFEGLKKNGKPEGKAFEYYRNGKIHKRFFYKEGELIYALVSNESGKAVNSVLSIDVQPLNGNNKVKKDEKHEVEIELEYSLFETPGMRVILGNLDKNKHLIDTTYIEETDSLKMKYAFLATQKGKQTLSGVITELDLQNNQSGGGQYYFEYNYFVE
ncbi:MAG: hypothetical protein CMO01_12405 [Thalassobius sp.]|nr:hypothetical protein [Thalassovita sp.]